MSDIQAFTAEQVCRLTRLSPRQLAYWDKTEFFQPEYLSEYRTRAFGRIYSFRDVVGLRVIAILRNDHHVPLQELRRVGAWLQTHHQTPWSGLRLGLSGRKITFLDVSKGVFVEASESGQEVFEMNLELIASEMQQAASALRERGPDQIGQVVRNRFVVHNAYVVAGTRIPTLAIWNFHDAGYTVAQILAEYPRLTVPDVAAAIEFEKARRKAA